jgi:hypothetical protein
MEPFETPDHDALPADVTPDDPEFDLQEPGWLGPAVVDDEFEDVDHTYEA